MSPTVVFAAACTALVSGTLTCLKHLRVYIPRRAAGMSLKFPASIRGVISFVFFPGCSFGLFSPTRLTATAGNPA